MSGQGWTITPDSNGDDQARDGVKPEVSKFDAGRGTSYLLNLKLGSMALAMTHQLIIDYEDDLLANVALSPEEFAKEARLLLAAQLYHQGRVSSGQAAKLCGKGRVEFLLSLARVGIPMSNLRPDDADLEIDFARNG